MPTQDTALVAAVFAVLSWLLSVVLIVLKGRDMVTKVALDAVGSMHGRTVVLSIVSDQSARIEEKLDALAKSMETLGRRIDSMSDRLQTQLSTLDAEARELQIRMAILEEKRGGRREER